MSHITQIQVEVRDLAALKAACTRLGWEWREGQTRYKWYGRWVGDTALPEGVRMEDLGKCTHAIRVPGASYEVGVLQQGDRYSLLYDFYGPGGLESKLGPNAEVLVQAYAVEAARAEAQRQGWSVFEEECEDGSVKLHLMEVG